MIYQSIEKIGERDLLNLIEARRGEGAQLDYKRELPGASDADRKEFLADVSSFANTSGGDLVIGISEAHDEKGVAGQLVPLEPSLADAAVLRIESMIRDGLAPRLTDVRIQKVTVTGGMALVIRIGRSFIGPHQVSFQNSGRFFARNGAGKYQMDVTEIGRSFRRSADLPAQLRQFHRERVEALVAGNSLVPLSPGGLVVVHAVPIPSFLDAVTVDISAFRSHRDRIQPLYVDHPNSPRHNLDGLLVHGIKPAGTNHYLSYAQVFRNSTIETACSALIDTPRETEIYLPIDLVEAEIMKAVDNYCRVLLDVNAGLPISIHVSISGTKGLVIQRGLGPFANRGLTPVDRDLLSLPHVLFDDPLVTIPQVVRPLLDALWQSGGHERCLNYDERGDYKPNRR